MKMKTAERSIDFDTNDAVINYVSLLGDAGQFISSEIDLPGTGLSKEGRAKLLHESSRRRRIDEAMKVSFLVTLTEKEWERSQCELERQTVMARN